MRFYLTKTKIKAEEYKKGMTYVELIVVLSIFSIMSVVSILNFGEFQARIDIKNLANDIALQIVGAQKNAMAGKLPAGFFDPSWKPAHGVHFDLIEKYSFKSFADINYSNIYDPSVETVICQNDGECTDKIDITKGNYITYLEVFGSSNCIGSASQNLDIVFRRPDSSAIISQDGINCGYFKEAVIGILSPDNVGAKIYVYPSGRIEIK